MTNEEQNPTLRWECPSCRGYRHTGGYRDRDGWTIPIPCETCGGVGYSFPLDDPDDIEEWWESFPPMAPA